MVKRPFPEFATSPTESPTTLMPRLPSSRRQGTGTDDIFRELPGQSTYSSPFTQKNAVTADEDTDPRTEHVSDTSTFPSLTRAKHPPQLALQMRPNASPNPFLHPSRQDSPPFDGQVCLLPRRLPRLAAVEAFNGEETGFVTPMLSPASTSPLFPPPIPPRTSTESEEDIFPSGIPAELLFPVLA